jgi:hypothetical protein
LIRKISGLIALVLCLGVLSAAPAQADHPPLMLGPGDANVNGIGHQAVIRYSKFGPVYITGKHNQHLRVTHVEKLNSIRFRDTRTDRVKGGVPDRCHKEKVKKGISVVCKIPPRFAKQRMFIQVWPRLGHDYTDGRTLPKRFRLWVLTDAGNDITYGGAGNDFVNGAKGNDRAYGGGGRDWLRGGPGADRLVGGTGHDRIAHG